MATLTKAIVDLFNADTPLQTTVPGGAVIGDIEEQSNVPYCSITLPGGNTVNTTGTPYIAEMDIVFTVRGNTFNAVRLAAKDIRDLFDKDATSMTFDEGTVMSWHRTNEPIYAQEEDNPARWLAVLTYMLMLNLTQG